MPRPRVPDHLRKRAPGGGRKPSKSPRAPYGTAYTTPEEATTLDTLRRPDEAPGHMLGRVALVVAVDPELSAAVAAKETK